MTSSISLLSALLKMKFPRCRKGNAFKDPNPYHLKHLGGMNDLCLVCKLNFRPEPGFYFEGAIISYPLMVIFCLFVTLLFYFIVGDLLHHIPAILITLLIASVLVAPVSFRYSRIIFLCILTRYEPKT